MSERERRLMAQRNAALTAEVEALRPKVDDLEWKLSLNEAALAAACESGRELKARARIAEQENAELKAEADQLRIVLATHASEAKQREAELVSIATKLRDLEYEAGQASIANQGQMMDGFALLANYRALADKAHAILAKHEQERPDD